MRLLTHNYLQSNVKGTEEGYPLGIVPETVEIEKSPVDRELLLSILPKLNYDAVHQAVAQLRLHCSTLPKLPSTLPENISNDENLVNDLYFVLFDVHVKNGCLVCPATQRKFPIKDGIPNMILHEDEI
ncbi:multifunctional methyltransferase subunit TRM112 [Fistulifera solaris]|uniref:Multifunctional methyltransferase subunit TRM112 n=1 Tax=Fistulifera solaris TaxID=1519565 RepID=A0A1Z5KKU7_FISSO|nr:multifunctional methyltransferase subunit TRM112 [Fistulifera solaris]|eukprot:GAX26934.1 multifunctional methyltransferase subunit TRM112 [Fistulifera solaris]